MVLASGRIGHGTMPLARQVLSTVIGPLNWSEFRPPWVGRCKMVCDVPSFSSELAVGDEVQKLLPALLADA